MAGLTLVSSIVLLLCSAAAAAAAASTFEDSNPILMVSDGLRGFESTVLRVIGHSRHAISFARFAYKNGKKYENVEEMKLRFQIFKDNYDLIRSTNRKGLPYTLAVNQFADWTWEEFQKHRLGAAQNCSATTMGNHQLTNVVLPESKDWREAGIVSPVKDQGNCGSCWTFSTTGALEAAYHQAFGKGISLSEQQLVDCAGAFNNFGCNVIDSVNITLGSEDELKHAVAVVRPVSVAFEVVTSFRFYRSGVYTSNTCGNTPMDVNHAVVAVGYGVENGVPYWLIKNSWGATWGDNGYFKMEMGKNMCGVATCASYPVVA
ncbi:hypothetical protein V6N13_025922 [Hibiscus sabdariffa]|uniref:Uncharacterized protein n=2 Tax=Hibiscus sabdariffa TaxID=183260 RepID=A0ABR2NFC5_9ROSI